MKWARRYFQDAPDGSPQWLFRWSSYRARLTTDPALALSFDTAEEANLRTACNMPLRTVRHPLKEEEAPWRW